MIETNIPTSIQEILDVYIRNGFFPLTYKRLASNLDLKVDTLIQRIRRNPEYFEIDDSQRPSKITVKRGIEEIYFYRDQNRCQLCQKYKEPESLLLRFRNPHQKDKYDWKNTLSVCEDCKDKEIVKKVKKIKKGNIGIEYKETLISLVYRSNPKTGDSEIYYEFDEYDGTGAFPLIDDKGKIASTTISDILNYFGAERWDVVKIQNFINFEGEETGDYHVIFKRKRRSKNK